MTIQTRDSRAETIANTVGTVHNGPDSARARLKAAGEAYSTANADIALMGLYLTATQVRETFPDAASFTADWCYDDGIDCLSGILQAVTMRDGTKVDSESDLEQLAAALDDFYADELLNLDEANASTWQPFAAERGPFTFNVDTILTDLAPKPEPSEVETLAAHLHRTFGVGDRGAGYENLSTGGKNAWRDHARAALVAMRGES